MFYPKAPTYEIILATKLKNAINKLKGAMDLEFKIHNISINGRKRGCSGFIKNIQNGTVVYINTEDPLADGYLRRYARNMKDYEGGINQFSTSIENLVKDIIKMLEYRVAFNIPPVRIIDKKTGKIL